MALVSGIGAGSGLDINSLVTQLVAAERAAPSAAINRREARANAQISALGSVKSAFASLQTAINAFKPGTLFDGRSFSSSESDFATAKAAASGTAVVGSFEVVVDRLASAYKIRFNETPTATTLDEGTLSFTYGPNPEDTFNVVVDSENNTLRQLSAAINAQANGKGLVASVVTSGTGESLVLTALQSGDNSTITVAQTAGPGDLSAFETGTPANFTELAPALDARAYIDGILVTSSTNTISGAVDGVDITLKKLTDGLGSNPANARITVDENIAGAKSAIQSFVKAYNDVFAAVGKATAFDIEKGTSAALNGDALTRGAATQARNALSNFLADAGQAGVITGLSSDAKGVLSFDTSKFDAAYAADPSAVRSLFSGESGSLYSRFAPSIDSLLSSDGVFATRETSLKNQLDSALDAREALELRLVQVEARYRRQFTALDALIGQLSNTSNFLSSQLANLPSPGGN